MTLLDQMQKRPGTMIVAVFFLNVIVYSALFVGALLVIKRIFF